MSANQLAIVILRFFAIFFFAGALEYSINIMALIFMDNTQFTASHLIYVISMAINFSFAFLLWFFAPKVADKVAQSDDKKDANLVNYENTFIIMTVAAGLFILSEAIVPVSKAIFIIKNGDFDSSYNLEQLVIAGLYLGLALFLIITPKGLLKIVRYTRTAGQYKDEEIL